MELAGVGFWDWGAVEECVIGGLLVEGFDVEFGVLVADLAV